MHMVHGHGIKKDGSDTKARKKRGSKPRLSTSGVKGIIVDVPHALKFCPCCGLNIELAAKALDIAQEMGA